MSGTAEEPLAARRAAVLDAALERAGGTGWTAALLAEAGAACGEEAGALAVLFPGGIADLLTAYSDRLDGAMTAALQAAPLETMKIRERIKHGIRARIEAIAPHLDAGRRAAALLALPPFAPLGLQLAYRTADALWREAGDRSTDFNFYTKRALATGVYLATLIVWLRDRTPEKEEAWRVLDQRLSDVMVIEGAKIQVRKFAALLPSPWAVLGALRYPGGPAE